MARRWRGARVDPGRRHPGRSWKKRRSTRSSACWTGVGVGDGTRLLEIGSGWGELAIRAAQRGATVVTLTLSSEQQDPRPANASPRPGSPTGSRWNCATTASERGTYDAVVSVEMIEAVGHESLPAHFATIDRVLALGGRAGIQAISMGHERMQASLGTYTWINKYIFPGGFIPSLRLVDEVLAEHTSLHVAERFDFGLHYAETLRLWRRERFDALDTRPLGFDEVFDRMWRFDPGYSRAGFASGYLDVSQLVLARR
ncbi:MAG: class I SAM-dependent methyltransferase [Nocardioides sp.]